MLLSQNLPKDFPESTQGALLKMPQAAQREKGQLPNQAITMTIDTEKLAVRLNNVGTRVLTLQEDYELALELFKCSYKLLLPRQLVDTPNLVEAETHLRIIESQTEGIQPLLSRQTGPQENDQSNFPYLVKMPFQIRVYDGCFDENNHDLIAAKVLFNIALSHQLIQPNKAQVAGFYHMSTAALANVEDSDDTFLLAVASMNNFAVWCHATGDFDGQLSGMAKLRQLMADEEYASTLDGTSKFGIQSNMFSLCENMVPKGEDLRAHSFRHDRLENIQ